MTENNDLLNDDFLRNLVRKSSLDVPSDGFVEKVMEQIRPQPEFVPVKTSLVTYLKSFFGFFVIAAILAGFFWTSDISVLGWLPGKQYFINTILPSFDFLFTWSKYITGSGKSFSIPIMILIASGLFFLLDRFLVYRNSARNYPSA
jgi:hypothetical protein